MESCKSSEKNCRPCKPGSVSARERPDLCHLSTTAVACRLQQPTPRYRASHPSLYQAAAAIDLYGSSPSDPLNKKPVYTVLQPTGRTAGEHRCLRGGLLPRLFTLTRPTCARAFERAVVFCYASIPSRVSSRLACVALCVARTFLSRFASAATERACGAKVIVFIFNQINNLIKLKRK